MGQKASKEEKAARRNKRKGSIHEPPVAAPRAAAASSAAILAPPPPTATNLSPTLPKSFSMSPAERMHTRPRVGSISSSSLYGAARRQNDVDGVEDHKVSDSDDSDDILSDDASVVVEDWLLEGDDIHVEMTTEVSLTAYMLANRPLYDIMIQVQLFANLSQSQQEQVLKALKPITFKDGETIVKQGDRGERFFMIAKGEAVVTKLIDGKERMVTHLYAGHYFGELALIYDDPRTASVGPGGVELLYLTQKDFQQVGKVHLSLMLQQVPLLAHLSARDQDVVLTKLKPHAHVATSSSGYQGKGHWTGPSLGEYIVRQGEEGTRFYMITRGQAAVIETDAGEDKELTRLYEGHVFGEMSLIYKEPRTASVVAVGPVKCLYLTKEDFDECLLSERFQRVIQHAYIEKATRRAMRNKTNRLLRHSATAEYVHHDLSPPPLCTVQSPRQCDLIPCRNATSFTDSATPNDLPRHSIALETSTLRKHRLANGETVVNKYVIKGELGKGSFGTVKLCANEEDGQLYAVKIMHKTFVQRMANREDSLQDALRREVAIMKKLDHRNVVRLVEVIDDPSSQKVYLVQEYIEKGNLAEVAGGAPLPEALARKYLRDMLCGLQYLHFHKVVHRDIKPENILVTSDDVAKIADFGAARMVMNEAETLTVAKGTPVIDTYTCIVAFMAPEMFNIDAEYTGPSVDVWSLGATLFMLVFGHPPWSADNEIELADKVQRDELTFPEGVVLEPHLKNLLTRMLTKDPERRIVLADVINHEWVTCEGSHPIVNVFKGDQSTVNVVSLDESERAIENIPERIDERLQASLIQAHLILQQKKQQPPLNLSLRSHGSMNSMSSSSDRGSIATATSSPKRTASAATVIPHNHHHHHLHLKHPSTGSAASLRSKGSQDSMFGHETSRVISAWRHHKRVALMDGHNLSERVRDLLLEQKRMAFSVERAHVTEIILPASKQPCHTPTTGPPGDGPKPEPLTDDDLSKRQLSRKKDFLMVTSEVFRNEAGDYQARKVLFQATSQDFSVASRIPLHPLAGSSDDVTMGRKATNMRKSSRTSSRGGGARGSETAGDGGGSRSNSASKLSTSDLFADVAMVDDDVASDDDDDDEVVDQVMGDDGDSLGLLDSGRLLLSQPRVGNSRHRSHGDTSSNSSHSRSSSSSSDADESDYSDADENVDVNDTFDDLLQSPRFHVADADVDVAPIDDDDDHHHEGMHAVVQVYVSSKIRENLGLGLRAGYAEAKGSRPYMEDRSLALARCPFDESVAFFGVFDGHNGSDTAMALQADLHHRIWNHWTTTSSLSPQTAIELGTLFFMVYISIPMFGKVCLLHCTWAMFLVEDQIYIYTLLAGCRDMDDELLRRDMERIAAQKNERMPTPMSFSGSAAVFAVLVKQSDDVALYVANVGDCRGVLCQDGDAIDLTIDHKANNPSEKARVCPRE
ncbi:hypothetical protein AaE_008991 [Aphanomyces astaci]|uniref:cGMP-dependent protein kinase n=1 Tax=Aphanomyces astaci TaxID=112090 RepID=A0A6A5ADD8_APHAT|nr:hypothetical protein AaE_008991 [Aphanomyces astaci]